MPPPAIPHARASPLAVPHATGPPSIPKARAGPPAVPKAAHGTAQHHAPPSIPKKHGPPVVPKKALGAGAGYPPAIPHKVSLPHGGPAAPERSVPWSCYTLTPQVSRGQRAVPECMKVH
jgi:hypothetical protein